jgi:protein SCO1/2
MKAMLTISLAMAAVMTALCGGARADDVPSAAGGTQIPAAYRNVGVDEHLNQQLPLDARFYDENGQFITLGQILRPGHPMILQLGYLDCPMLCDAVSRSVVDSAKNIELQIGKDWDFAFVSIDPTDSPALATLKRNSYVTEYGKPESRSGFHVLIGKPDEIGILAATVGFRYQPADNGQFAHPAVIMVITPDGKISRYLYGVSFPSQTLRLSLVEASAGKIGTTVDQILLICLHWDPTAGKYSMAAMNLVRAGGVLTVMVLAASIFWMSKHGLPGQKPNSDPADGKSDGKI